METKTDILGAYMQAIEQANTVIAGVRPDLMETLPHTWDLAKPTGQLDVLDPELAEAGVTVARGVVSPEVRNDAGDPFAAEVPVPQRAAPYDRLVGFLGRTP